MTWTENFALKFYVFLNYYFNRTVFNKLLSQKTHLCC